MVEHLNLEEICTKIDPNLCQHEPKLEQHATTVGRLKNKLMHVWFQNESTIELVNKRRTFIE